MPPRGFANPAPKTESARSALNSFTCTLCNKSYSRHPEYEAHIGSYDHQHRKRLQDLKQLSRDPNAAEKARRSERKADAEAGLRVIDSNPSGGPTIAGSSTTTITSTSGGGFKKGGFKSSFTSVKGPVASTSLTKRNVLGDDDVEDTGEPKDVLPKDRPSSGKPTATHHDAESDTDEDYTIDAGEGGYYDPRKPTGCFTGCPGAVNA
ncbi:hypothetical protein ASPZODRAFT_120003 [Penicilliopsis zonata CBS 506.65]|uniref:C2H2-type domain-containing protein n=1 Tax=Penicilliopsis zonata CBS 506.65 TaxID=1073090 RepID=A0A1L9SEC4_9EURO|nr:hypothetical protein ASPZODRAFT_120003 [Penicilliopsis zonata CBS 506.65]OJJ45529.1 hypothetical protein ASPZODRAFT_120003 [Penicilliopsis zonata CBS 506.65]